MKQVSIFHKGVTTDLDYSKLDNQGMQLPTANIQLLNKDGQGLIVTPVKGNKVAFELTAGFQMIGSAEYNGIAYIASYNPDTGQGEIGSFPSPNFSTNTFEEVYRPLNNLVSSGTAISRGRLGPMRSTVFNFDLEHPIGDQMIALQDYDGSVNLIFTDNKNVLRLLNSGFNQEAQDLPERHYKTASLASSIQLIKELPGKQKINFVGEFSGGELRFGNYFFFYRYVDNSNNRTEFVAESQPITVTKSDGNDSTVLTTGFDEKSTKKITLNVGALDSAFTYIEFAFIRFLSSGSGVAFPEVMLVDKFFPVPSSGGNLECEINGFETQIPLNISEILRPVNRESICKSILAHDRRIWGANWKAEPLNYPALSEFALNIRLGYNDTKEIPNWELIKFYSDPKNLKYSGYFRGESYIAGVVFVLKNGYKSPRFPVKGIDARTLMQKQIGAAYDDGVLTNNNGIIAMPTNQSSPYVRDTVMPGGKRGFGRILAMTFDVSKAKEWLNLGGAKAKWIEENVREVIFVRADRKENLLYQGVTSLVYGQNLGSGSNYKNNGVSIPILTTHNLNNPDLQEIIDGSLPTTEYKFTSNIFGAPKLQVQFTSWGLGKGTDEEQKRRAIFSPDYILGDKNKISDGDGDVYVKSECRQRYITFRDGSILPPSIMNHFEGAAWGGSNFLFKSKRITNVYDGSNWVLPGNAKESFVNKVGNGGEDIHTSQLLFWRTDSLGRIIRISRNMIVPPYLGFEMEAETLKASSNVFDYFGRIVNVYRQNPNEINPVDLYSDELNLVYSSINHENFYLDQLDETPKVVCYQGDCFIQNVVIKIKTWEATNEIGHVLGENEKEIGVDVSAHGYGGTATQNRIRYAHGQLVEIVTENKNNLALRMATPNETAYYPALKSDVNVSYNNQSWVLGKNEWAYFPYSPEVVGWKMQLGTGIESYLFNPANSRTISINNYLSTNPNIPKGRDVFPNRIRYTGKQEPNFPILAYRMWSYVQKQDFEERFGEMTKLSLVFGRLVSIQRNSIFVHFTNQEETVPTSSGEMVIGVRSILSKEPTIIARFGSQHIFSIQQSKSGTYGWDWMNNVLWRIIMNDEGFLMARSLDKEKYVENYLKELKSLKDGENSGLSTNIIRGMNDLVFLNGDDQEGLITGYDKKNGELLFTSFFNGRTEVLRFNEDMSAFIGTFSFPVKFFFNIHNDLFSARNTASFLGTTKEKLYIHSAGMSARFYGDYYTPVLSFIVNGYLSEEEAYVNIDKLFKAMEIEAPRHPLPIDKIEFKTLFQEGRNDPFHDEVRFWLTPEYLMSKWAFPLNVAHKGQEQFFVESNMQGKWLKVTIYFNKGIDFFVKNVITNFISSHA